MRLNAGEQHFTRSVGDLVTRIPESTVNKMKRRKTTRNQESEVSAVLVADKTNTDLNDKHYMSAITPEGVVIMCGEFYSVREFDNNIFLLSKIVEFKDNFICTLILCKRNEKGLLCHSEGLELNVEWNHVVLCSRTFSCKNVCKKLLVKQKEVKNDAFVAVNESLAKAPSLSAYSKTTRRFQLAVKIREEVGKSFCSKGYKITIKLGILDLVNDPSLLGLDIKQSGLKKEFDLISTGFNDLDLLLGAGTTNFRQTKTRCIFILLLA